MHALYLKNLSITTNNLRVEPKYREAVPTFFAYHNFCYHDFVMKNTGHRAKVHYIITRLHHPGQYWFFASV